MKKGIITTQPVDKTFEGEPCLLRRTIVSVTKEKEHKLFVVRTERCNYVDARKPVLNKDGSAALDETGKRAFETVQELRIINRKDVDTVQRYENSKIDELYQAIKSEVALTDSYWQFEEQCERKALLLQTRLDNAWGIAPELWKLEN